MQAIKIFPSLIASNLINIEKTLVELGPVCDGFHIDVMDNHFVPNLTWGPAFVNQIAHFSDKPLSVHLMTEKTQILIQQLKLKPKSTIIVHAEDSMIEESINHIHAKKLNVGVALKPKTDLKTVFPYVKKIDQVMLMSVEPGFSGQKFIQESVEKLKNLIEYKKQNNLMFEIAMDGGINQNNIHHLAQLGCSVFCIASAIFDAKDHVYAIKLLHDKALEG